MIRSSTFQLLLLAFDDDEVTEEKRTLLQQLLNELRYPSTISDVFALQQTKKPDCYTPVFSNSARKSKDKGNVHGKHKNSVSADGHKKYAVFLHTYTTGTD